MAAQLPQAPLPDGAGWTWLKWTSYSPLSSAKNEVIVMTLVARSTSSIVGWAVALSRELALQQSLVDHAPQARFYYSDLFATERTLLYQPGLYTSMPDKSETYRAEGGNAELYHHTARLARQSRRFSRCLLALVRGVKFFVYLWNARQLAHQCFAAYPYQFIDFLPALA